MNLISELETSLQNSLVGGEYAPAKGEWYEICLYVPMAWYLEIIDHSYTWLQEFKYDYA